MLQGVTSFHDDATPIWALPQSSSVMPMARSMARAGARSMPSVTSRDRCLMSTGVGWCRCLAHDRERLRRTHRRSVARTRGADHRARIAPCSDPTTATSPRRSERHRSTRGHPRVRPRRVARPVVLGAVERRAPGPPASPPRRSRCPATTGPATAPASGLGCRATSRTCGPWSSRSTARSSSSATRWAATSPSGCSMERPPDGLAGVVLIASVPRRGVAGVTGRLLRRAPGPHRASARSPPISTGSSSPSIWCGPASSPRDDRARWSSSAARRLQNESILRVPARCWSASPALDRTAHR